MDSARPDAVLLVHGTFARSKQRCDKGRRWWQKSDHAPTFLNWLNTQLDGVAQCERVFHWSGENKEQERRRAGRELLEVLRAYEQQGRAYHLVGHSHGGSVIWCALRDAARQAKGGTGDGPLPNLRSWTTVGTPFLTYGVRWSDLLFFVPLLIAGFLLPGLLGQWGVVGRYFGTLWFPPGVPASHHGGLVALGLVHAMALLLLALVMYRAAGRLLLRRSRAKPNFWHRWDVLAGLALIALGALFGAHLGSTRLGMTGALPSETHSSRRALVGLALLWGVVAAVFGYALYRVGIVLYASWLCARDHRADLLASRAFRDRGQCLWSREDEAINGLRTTLQLHDLRRVPDDGLDDLDEPGDASALAPHPNGNGRAAPSGEPVRILPRKGLASAVFAPLVDQFFFEVLKQFLQGNDLLGRRLAAVTAEPPGEPAAPALSDALQNALEQRVADGFAEVPATLHRLRRVLGAVAYGGQLQSPFEGEAGQAAPVHTALLIHTMYFPEARGDEGRDGPPIPSLIASRIVSRARAEAAGTRRVASWIPIDDGPTGHATAGLPQLVAPGTLEWSRMKASMVPLAGAVALSAALLLPAMAGARLFDQIRPATDEGQIQGLVSAARGVVHDAAADSEAFPYLIDWASALAGASARGSLHATGATLLERRVIPPVEVSAQAAREAVEEIDDHHVRAVVSVQLAERLAALPASSPARPAALDLASTAVKAAGRAREDYPDTAAEVIVRAAGVAHALGKDDQAMTWVRIAGTAAIKEINERFLKLRTLNENIQRGFAAPSAPANAPAPVNAPALEAPPAPSPDGGPGSYPFESPAQNRPPSNSPIQAPIGEMPAPGALAPPPEQPTTISQLPLPMVFMGMGSPQETLANRLVPVLLHASALAAAIDPKSTLPKSLVEDLVTAHRNAGSMAMAKGGGVHFWQFGARERLLLASRMKEVGLDGWERLRPSARELPPLGFDPNPELAWWALAERPDDPIAAIVSPAHALVTLGLSDELAKQAESWASADSIMSGSPESLVGYAALMTALHHPEAARPVAEAVLKRLDQIQPHPDERYRAGFSNELYAETYQRGVDQHALRRILLRLDLARLALANQGDLSPQSLIAASWDDAVTIQSRAPRRVEVAPSHLQLGAQQRPTVAPGSGESRWTPPVVMDRLDPWKPDALAQVSRASALAGILATASHLDPKRPDTATIQKDVLSRYQALSKSADAKLADEAKYCEPLGRALRHFAGAFASRGEFADAEKVAALIDEPRQRLSSWLLIASYQMRGTENDRRQAREILEAVQSEISTIDRRRDRSPRLAEAAALWAMQGDFGRAVAAREECRLADRLQADAAILGWFALPPDASASMPLPDLFDPPPVFDVPPNGGVELLAPAAPAPMAPTLPVPVGAPAPSEPPL